MQVHLPDQQRVYFQEGEEELAADAGDRDTMLMGWFQLNGHDRYAKTLLYSEVGEKYVWNKSNRAWTLRKVFKLIFLF
jgi:hypothetical protein